MLRAMRRVHVVGGKNHGKTGLIVDLVRQLAAWNLTVGTIKHTHHQHELDVPGKDSHRHRESGAAVAGIMSRHMNAIFWSPTQVVGGGARGAAVGGYDAFASLYADCDLVLVEGDLQADARKVEVWRSALGTAPYAATDTTISAVITDDPIAVAAPVWPRAQVRQVARAILDFFDGEFPA